MTTQTMTLTDFLLARVAEDEDGAAQRARIKLIARSSRLPGPTFDESRRIVRTLSRRYADHPDYRDEWRP